MKIYRYIANVKTEIHDIEVDSQTELKQSLGGEDIIVSRFQKSGAKLDIQLGDFVEFKAAAYTILDEPTIKKEKEFFEYKIEFKSDLYYLKNVQVLNPGLLETEFHLFGNAIDMVSLIIQNLNRVYNTGAIYFADYVEETESKLISFSNENCLAALNRMGQEFGCEFRVVGKQITFRKKIANETGLIFKYKRDLQHIERTTVQNGELVTRLYVYGSDRNITNTYGSKRLKIAPIENNVNLFGIIERTVVYEDIYPRLKGVVATAPTLTSIVDTGIDFNINSQLMGGITAQIIFNTGDLAGREYDITGYHNTEKRITFNAYTDESDLTTPNDVLKPRVGDKYVLVGIKMPQAYIDNAEAELLELGTEYLQKFSLPNVIYKIQPHYPELRRNTRDLNIGDIVTIEDLDFGINFQTRILSLRQKLHNEYEYQIEIGQQVTVNYFTQVLGNQRDIRNELYFRDNYYSERFNRIFNGVKEFTQAVFVNRGLFSETTYYYNNQNRIDYVYILNAQGIKEWYYFVGQDHSRGAWNLANWKFIGDNFDIIATQTILAENANIGNWIIQNGQIVSQSTVNGKPTAQLNGLEGFLRFISQINVQGYGGVFQSYEQTVTVGAGGDGITATRPDGGTHQTGAYVEFSSNGLQTSFAGQLAAIPPTGKAGMTSILGIGRSKLNDPNSWIAGIVGWAESLTTLNPSPTFGGLFWRLKSIGRTKGITRLPNAQSSPYHVKKYDEYLSCYNGFPLQVHLTANPYEGDIIYVRRNLHYIEVYPTNNKKLVREGFVPFVGIEKGDVWQFIYDGQSWLANFQGRK